MKLITIPLCLILLIEVLQAITLVIITESRTKPSLLVPFTSPQIPRFTEMERAAVCRVLPLRILLTEPSVLFHVP